MASFQSSACILLLLSLMAVAVSAKKTTHLHFYVHEFLGSPRATAVTVARGPTRPSPLLNYGDILVMDDPVTSGPNLTSSTIPLGRSQGLQAFDSASAQGANASLFIANFVFQEGRYNGSTLVVLGHDAVLMPVRELPVVGGSGRFRLARGYALVKTYWLNATSGDAILEWDIYAMHH